MWISHVYTISTLTWTRMVASRAGLRLVLLASKVRCTHGCAFAGFWLSQRSRSCGPRGDCGNDDSMRTVFSKRCSPNVAWMLRWTTSLRGLQPSPMKPVCKIETVIVLGVVLDYSLLLCGSLLPLHSYIVFCDVILLVVGSSTRATSEVCSLG